MPRVRGSFLSVELDWVTAPRAVERANAWADEGAREARFTLHCTSAGSRWKMVIIADSRRGCPPGRRRGAGAGLGVDYSGRAAARIIHGLVPGARLFFATADGGPSNFADNTRALRNTHGRDIVVAAGAASSNRPCARARLRAGPWATWHGNSRGGR